MLSRAACVPRICLSCRLGLATSRASLSARPSPHQKRWARKPAYPSDPIVQSKERIEALISGTLDESESKPPVKQSGKPKKSDQRPQPQGRATKHGFQKDADKGLPDSGQVLEEVTIPAAIADESTTNLEDAKVEPLGEAPEQPTENELPTNENREPEPEPEPEQTFRDEFIDHKGLGIKALGKQVEALVIKNPNRMRRAKRTSRIVEEEVRAAPLDLHWEDVIKKEGETEEEALADAMKNIDALRPIDATSLRIRDFDDLVNKLLDGFLTNQLMNYVVQKLEDNKGETLDTSRYSWILEESPWQAAKPDHFDWAVLTQKQRAAVKIIQTIWNLEVQEQVEGTGRKTIRLRPEVFRLISQPSSRVLESLRAEFLYGSNQEKISPNFDGSSVDIYAPKATIAVILTRLDEIVRSIASQKISVGNIKDEDLLPEVLEDLGRITKTIISHNEQSAELDISWFRDDGWSHAATTDQDNTARQTESPADVVLRLLTGCQTWEFKKTNLTSISSKGTEFKKGLPVSHQREKRSMSWRDKLQQWFRYVAPVQRASAETNASIQFTLPAPRLTAEQGKIENQIVATFGHILHYEAQREKLDKNRRILSPVVPHPAALTSITVEDKPILQHTAIILNFAPNPAHVTGLDGTSPKVCLRLPVDPDTDLSNFSFPPNSTLHGVVPRHVNDVLLPSESVDVRLSQHRLLTLDVNQQSLKDFLAVCEFNLLEGRLRTPSKTTFSIPTKWLSSKKTKSPTTDVPYMFMGLEIHQTVEMEWQGHTLRYNSIEAGQHGGQRQELSLQAGPPQNADEPRHPLAKAEYDHFLQLVGEVATGKHFSWHDGYQLMKERSDEKFSLDMLDEDFAEEKPLSEKSEESETLPPSQEIEYPPQEPATQDQPEATNSSSNEEAQVTPETPPSPETTSSTPTPEPKENKST